MSDSIVKAAVRACIALSDAIDAMADCERIQPDTLCDIRGDLSQAYTLLTDHLSTELSCDARELIQSVIEAELEASRTILTAQTGLRFPIAATVKE